MRRNGHKTNGTTPDPFAALVIPNVEFQEREYAKLRMRLDLYDDVVLAQKYKDGIGAGFYSLDPLDVATALAGLTLATPMLPPGCLFWQRPSTSSGQAQDGGERLAIYAGPQVWRVNVAFPGSNDDPKRKRGKRVLWRVPMPGLVWIGQGTTYKLYAVKGADHPTAETQIYKAPCPNVSDGICQGDVRFPAASAATMWPALRLFFESDFNNHLTNGKSKRFDKNVLAMWEELNAGGAEAWPEDDLVSAQTTLGRVMG